MFSAGILCIYLGSSSYYLCKKNAYSLNLVKFFNICTTLGQKHYYFITIIFCYLFSSKRLSVTVFSAYFIINTYLLDFFKQLFKEPKAFWDCQNIKLFQANCEKGYGYPSGHSWLQLLFYEYIFMEFLTNKLIKQPWNKIGLIFIAMTSIFIPLSRLYLGAHSINQTNDALLIAFFSVIFYRYYFQQKLFKLIGKCLNHQKSIRLILIFIWIFFLATSVPIIAYFTDFEQKGPRSQYVLNIEQTCGGVKQEFKQVQRGILQSSSLIQILFGFLSACLLISRKKLPNNNSKLFILYLTSRWDRNSVKNMLISGFTHILVIYIMNKFFSQIRGRLYRGVDKYLLSCAFMFLVGITMVIIPLLLYHLKLIKVQKIEEQEYSLLGSKTNENVQKMFKQTKQYQQESV